MLQYSLFLTLMTAVISQEQLYECPQDWVSFDKTCYKFMYAPKLTYEKARRECADKFAALVSIDSLSEHNFIEKHLLDHDYYRNVWFTRGIQDILNQKLWYWDGEEKVIPVAEQYWIPNDQSNGIIIVYKYATAQYRWTTAGKNDALSYICEIPQNQAYRLSAERRTYEYGIPFNNLSYVEKGPKFIEQPSSVVVVSRTPRAVLECRATCHPACRYKWFRGLNLNDEITQSTDSRYTLTNGKLTIYNPDEDFDSNDYQCQVSNKIGTVLSNPVQLTFGSMGEFSNVQDAPVYARAFDGANIECSNIRMDPAGTYMWRRNDPPEEIITDINEYMFVSANGRLYFSEVTPRDATVYYCQVSLTSLTTSALGTSQAPSRTSRPIRMVIQNSAPKDNWGPEIQDDFIYVSPERPLKNFNVRMECFAYGSASDVRMWVYTWSRVKGDIPASAKVSDHGRVLTIENAQIEDEGNYVCHVSRGQTASHSKNVYLRLYAVPYYLVPLQAQHVDLGSHLTWKCEASGYPYPTYSWYKDGQLLQNVPGEISVVGNTLTINNLQEKHNGMYQCAAKNYLGTSMSEAQLRVLAFKPNFSKKPIRPDILGSLRGNVTIQCQPEAAPTPTIEWFFGASKLSNSDKHRHLLNGDLVITGLSGADQGIYRCKATNQYGSADSAGNLRVGGELTISTVPEVRDKVVQNETKFIRCQASSSDSSLDLVYVWYLNGHKIDLVKDSHYEQLVKQGATGLMVRMVQFRHEGMYECRAKTPVSEARASGYLEVLGPPNEPAGVMADTTTTTSLKLHWYCGDTNGDNVQYYGIQWRVETDQGDMTEWKYIDNENGGRVFEVDLQTTAEENTRNKRSYLVNNLKPGNVYQFRVMAKNGYNGFSPWSYPSPLTKTIEAPPIAMPAMVYGGNGSVGDLHIIWSKMPYEDRGHQVGGYKVHFRLHEEGENDRLWTTQIIDNWDKTFHVELVGADYFYLLYEVRVQAYNILGQGPNATALIYSAEGMPTVAPANVLADNYNSTAMEVTWDPVEDTREVMKGRLYGYQINYYSDDDVEPVYKQYIRYPGQMGSAVVIGLWANSNFWFQVHVYNTAGLGPPSDSYKQETAHLVTRLYPLEVAVHSRSSTSALITWRGITIKFDEATVQNYRLYLWPSNEHYRTAEEIDTDDLGTSFVLTNLEKGIVYALRIAAISDGGEGKKSPTVYFTLTGGANVAIDQTVTEFRAGAGASVVSMFVLIGCFVLSLIM